MPNKYHFDGRLAAAPSITNHGDLKVTKFTLIRNESRGKDDNGQAREERQVSVQFTAFNGLAELITKHCRKGDQIILGARLENNNYEKDGVETFGYNFVVEDFDFGAPGETKRKELESNRK